MGTVRKVGKRQLKVLCDCKRKHLITADDDGEVEIETFNPLPNEEKEDEPGEKKNRETKKNSDIFDLLGI